MDARPAQALSWPALFLLLPVQLWAAHAVVFFSHEYAHAFTAWALGWKRNPFALDYARPTLKVLLLQLGINQNVDEAPIFASGRGSDAAIIAAAGAVLGNGLVTLPLSRYLYRFALDRGWFGWGLFAYWCTVASIGNFLDYVPIRTFTLEGDMGSVQRGFGWSPWAIIVVLGLPTLLAVVWLFLRVMPLTLRRLFADDPRQRGLIGVLTCAVVFGFYGAAGLLEGGPISYRLSLASVGLILPLAIVAEIARLRAKGGTAALEAG